jgi:hypothetical protein
MFLKTLPIHHGFNSAKEYNNPYKQQNNVDTLKNISEYGKIY